MAAGLVKDSSAARNGSIEGLAESLAGVRAVNARHCSKRKLAPASDAGRGAQVDHFVALALQRHGQQSALAKGRGAALPRRRQDAAHGSRQPTIINQETSRRVRYVHAPAERTAKLRPSTT